MSELYALCEDGSIWMIESARKGWIQVVEIPAAATPQEVDHVG
jgi:hypothetical protein